MLLPLKNMAGKQTGEIEVSDVVFNAPVRPQLMHQALVRQLANARAGTHKTKTRGEIAKTTKKYGKQKGSGGARHGDKSAPQFRGGGKVFGPKPRDHSFDLPKKVRALALRHALSAKAKAGELIVLDKAEASDGKTSPEELVAAAHAACYSMAFSADLGRAGTPPRHLAVTADVTFDKIETGWTVTSSALTVRGSVPGITAEDFATIAAAAKDGCPISRALAGNVAISVTAILED